MVGCASRCRTTTSSAPTRLRVRAFALEGKLASVFAELERRADEDDRRDAKRRAREEESRRAGEQRAERERLARIEQARVERLTEEVRAWRLARDVRVYTQELRERLPELDDDERERVAAWCRWVEAWARHDPTVNAARIVGLDEVVPEPAPFWWGAAPRREGVR